MNSGRVRFRSHSRSQRVLRPVDRLRPNITGAIDRRAAGVGRVVGAGTTARRAVGATAIHRIGITGSRPTAIFSTGFLATAAIVQRRPPITRRRRRRALEKPTTSTVVVVGDSMADWLGYGLDEKYADQPEINIERKIRATAGLVRCDAKNEALDWPQAAKEALSNEKPDAIVVMLGLNDRLPLREKAAAQPKRSGEPAQGANQSVGQDSQDKAAPPAGAEASPQTAQQTESKQTAAGGPHDFHTDQWAALYAKRIDAMIAALKSKGVPVIWVGLPAIRGSKATSDMSYLDELYRERAERAGIIYINIWDGFVDEDGDYAVQGPDFEGQIRRLRTADGVYFTKAGAVKIASYVDHELRRVMPSYVESVALPSPETTTKSGPANARPPIGPVLPLTASGGYPGGALLGAEVHPTSTTSDPTAAKVLSRGETLAAPAGRADDFSWPRPGSGASAPDLPEPVAVGPGSPEKLGTAANGDDTNQPGSKKNSKGKSAISRASARIGLIITIQGAGTVDISPAGTTAGNLRNRSVLRCQTQ